MKSPGSSHVKAMLATLLVVGAVLLLGAAATWQPAGAMAQMEPGVMVGAAPPQTFTITPSAGDHGWVDPLTEQSVAAGGSLRFTITADPGYHIADVLVDDVSVGTPTSYEFTNVQADHTISATFAMDGEGPFTITPSAGAHGGITPPMPQSVAAGASLVFTITAEPGYHIADVLVDDVSVGARSSYQFTDVRADHTIRAIFAADAGRTYVITPSAGAHGGITPPVPQSVAAGGSIAFTIAAEPGYHVADVLVDGVSVGARTSYEFKNVQADHTISATFAANGSGPFTITPSAGAHGGITPSTPQTVTRGGSVRFTITADAGYHVADVLVDGTSVGARTSYEFTDVQADHTIRATFAEIGAGPFAITPSAGAHGAFTPSTPQSVAAGGSLLFTISADAGYHVADVLVDGVSVGARNSYEFTNVQADHTISASFAADTPSTFTITPSAGAHGGIAPSTPQSVAAGGRLLFTITADPGYHVSDVLVDGVGVGVRSSYEFTNVQADHSIDASFAADAGPSVTLASPVGGETWRSGSTQVIRWTLSAPVGVGRFTVWASSLGGDLTQLTPVGKPVAAVADRTAYQWSYAVALPISQTYQILVRYESDDGAVQSEARSPGRVQVLALAAVRISVTSPSGAVTWRRGTNQTIRWKLSEPVTAGVFRVWAVNAKGTRYQVTSAIKPIAAVAGKTSYSMRWKVTAPVGTGYRIVVEQWSGIKRLLSGKSTGVLTIKR